MFDFNKEREKLWKKLEKSGAVIDYQKPNNSRKYDIYLQNGLIVLKNGHTTEALTIDSFLYLWLEGVEY